MASEIAIAEADIAETPVNTQLHSEANAYVRLVRGRSTRFLAENILVPGENIWEIPFKIAAQLAIYRKNGVSSNWIDAQWKSLVLESQNYPSKILAANDCSGLEAEITGLHSLIGAPIDLFQGALDCLRDQMHNRGVEKHFADAILRVAFEQRLSTSKQTWEEFKLFWDIHCNDVRQKRYKETKNEKRFGPDFRRTDALNKRVEKEANKRKREHYAILLSVDRRCTSGTPPVYEQLAYKKQKCADESSADAKHRVLQWLRAAEGHVPRVFFPAAEKDFPWSRDLYCSFVGFDSKAPPLAQSEFWQKFRAVVKNVGLGAANTGIKKHGRNLQGYRLSIEDVDVVLRGNHSEPLLPDT